jgi:hypothetical protein
MLQITSIEIYKLLIPLKESFVISLGTQFNADNILIIFEPMMALAALTNTALT